MTLRKRTRPVLSAACASWRISTRARYVQRVGYTDASPSRLAVAGHAPGITLVLMGCPRASGAVSNLHNVWIRRWRDRDRRNDETQFAGTTTFKGYANHSDTKSLEWVHWPSTGVGHNHHARERGEGLKVATVREDRVKPFKRVFKPRRKTSETEHDGAVVRMDWELMFGSLLLLADQLASVVKSCQVESYCKNRHKIVQV